MKYLTAIVGSIFILLAVSFLVGLVLLLIMPPTWSRAGIQIGALRANIPSLIGMILGCVAARYTFKASLHAKTGKLYTEKDKNNQP
jgi:hypothetical protein